MRALILYCHPHEASFTAAVRDAVVDRLDASGAEIRLRDLYARGFSPTLSEAEWEGYLDAPANRDPVLSDIADLDWCDTLIFVYPTWWYGLPAVLKGWLDRVLLPEVAFHMPRDGDAGIRPALTHISRLGVFTTCGASWWLTRYVGAPGRRTLLRGVGLLCARPLRTVFAAHYDMDRSTPQSRARHLEKVRRQADRLVSGTRAGARRPRREASA